jgi:hypothetical protein
MRKRRRAALACSVYIHILQRHCIPHGRSERLTSMIRMICVVVNDNVSNLFSFLPAKILKQSSSRSTPFIYRRNSIIYPRISYVRKSFLDCNGTASESKRPLREGILGVLFNRSLEKLVQRLVWAGKIGCIRWDVRNQLQSVGLEIISSDHT